MAGLENTLSGGLDKQGSESAGNILSLGREQWRNLISESRLLAEGLHRRDMMVIDGLAWFSIDHLDRKQFARAEFFAREGIRLAEEWGCHSAAFWLQRGPLSGALLGQGKIDEALECLHRAYHLADSAPLSISASVAAAAKLESTLRGLGRIEEADAWNQKVIELIRLSAEIARRHRR